MRIDIWSDVVCPWCYIGKRRLEEAVAAFEGDVEIVWRSFELDPSAPKNPELPLDQALAKKYRMSLERARKMMDQMTQTAAKEGLDFDFSIARPGNTFDAHRLIHLARERGVQDEMKERLLLAYMSQGRPIADRDELASLAADVGLDAEEVRTMFSTGAHEEAVRQDEAQAHQIGVTGVPFFLVGDKYGVAGAQPADALLRVLKRVQAESTPDASPAGPGCDDGSCEIPERS